MHTICWRTNVENGVRITEERVSLEGMKKCVHSKEWMVCISPKTKYKIAMLHDGECIIEEVWTLGVGITKNKSKIRAALYEMKMHFDVRIMEIIGRWLNVKYVQC